MSRLLRDIHTDQQGQARSENSGGPHAGAHAWVRDKGAKVHWQGILESHAQDIAPFSDSPVERCTVCWTHGK